VAFSDFLGSSGLIGVGVEEREEWRGRGGISGGACSFKPNLQFKSQKGPAVPLSRGEQHWRTTRMQSHEIGVACCGGRGDGGCDGNEGAASFGVWCGGQLRGLCCVELREEGAVPSPPQLSASPRHTRDTLVLLSLPSRHHPHPVYQPKRAQRGGATTLLLSDLLRQGLAIRPNSHSPPTRPAACTPRSAPRPIAPATGNAGWI
jgi:hypothetical protein